MKKTILFCLLYTTVCSAFAQLNENVGIGVRLQLDSTQGYKTTKVLSLIPEGPAQAAGLQEGDFIVKVNEQSTRDVVLQDVVEMIVGKEGTEVRLVIERKGSKRNFNVTRRKYKYASAYYESAVKDNEFCSALTMLMNDAPYDFKITCDTNHYRDEKGAFGRRYYECKVKIPGAQKVSIASSFGKSGIITFGPYANTDEVNDAGEGIIAKIKTCFPDYYYKTVIEAKGSHTIEIGKNNKDGFESAILQMFSTYSETEHSYSLTLRVNGGKTTRYYTISTSAQNTSFASALRTIFNDIPNDYKNVKGTKHEIEGDIFSSGSSWYEVSPMPEGAHDCSIFEGGMSLSNGCKCRFYSGDNHDKALDAFKKLYDIMYDALGSEFVFSFEIPMLDMTIPENTESVVVFGIKKKSSYESLPLLALVLVKDSESHYSVNMLFHKFGF